MKNKFNILLIISAGILGYIVFIDEGFSSGVLPIIGFILFASTWWLAINELETIK